MEYQQMAMMSYTLALGKWGQSNDIVKLCQLTRKFGLEAIDWVTTYGVPPEKVKKICDDFGLKTICYTFFVDINFPEKKDRQPGIDKIKEGIETALVLGTDKIMLPLTGKDGLTRQESRKNCIEGLKEAVLIAEKSGITVTVEHFPMKSAPFIVSADVNEAIKEVPQLRVTYDSGNVLTGGENPVDGYLNSKDYVVHVHFKDFIYDDAVESNFQGADGRYYKPALIGEGLLDYPAIIKAMVDNNYKGYINFEYEGKTYTPEDAMEKGLKYLKHLFETIK